MLLWFGLVLFAWVAGPFLAAGSWAWPRGWSYSGVLGLGFLVHGRYVRRRNPELKKHRQGIGEGTKGWDVVWNFLFWPLLALAPIVAGFGVRFGWPALPLAAWPVGLACVALGLGVSARAMAVNPFFEGTVRLQKERGQTVVDRGPYRFVRHPGYVGLCLVALSGPFLTGSVPAFAPALAVVAWVAARTALEDALLRRELSGYAAYAQRVRFRLLPGVW